MTTDAAREAAQARQQGRELLPQTLIVFELHACR
jgi:hypothetical protein